MKTTSLKLASVAMLSLVLSACVVAPPQPVGYRMTSSVLPTYVNGQYVGMQPSNYIPPASTTTTTTTTTPATVTTPATSTTTSSTTTVANTYPAPAQQSPVYLQSTTPSVVYVQAPTPVYPAPYYGPSYYPYAYPCCGPYWGGYPWFGGIGVGLGFRIRVH